MSRSNRSHDTATNNAVSNRSRRLAEEFIDELKANDYQPRSSYHPEPETTYQEDRDFIENYPDPDASLRAKWMDNSPRMSRLREHRQKRMISRLEQFELWDIEQEKKQKQYDLAREQRYKTIVERLKSQEFCVNLMKKRHESDIETSRELETYSNDHTYFDALDDPKSQYKGPVSQYRKFQSEMDIKQRSLEHDIELVNPRHRITQAILPRVERIRERYGTEQDVFGKNGRRLLKKPTLEEFARQAKDIFAGAGTSLRTGAPSVDSRRVNFH